MKVSYCWSTTTVHQYSRRVRLFHCSFPLYLNISGWGVWGLRGTTTRGLLPPPPSVVYARLVVDFPPPRFITIHNMVTLNIEYNFFYHMLLVLLTACCVVLTYVSLRLKGFNVILVPIVPEISGTIFPENFRNDFPKHSGNFRNVPEFRNDPEFRNNVPEISGLREKNRSGNRSGIPDFRNLFHNGNGKNFRIISVRKP